MISEAARLFQSRLEELPEENVIASWAPRLMRFLWSIFLEPPADYEDFRRGFLQAFRAALVEISHGQLGIDEMEDGFRAWSKEYGEELKEGFEDIRAYRTLEEWIQGSLKAKATTDTFDRNLLDVWSKWQPRVAKLAPGLVTSISDIYVEYVQWLTKHPEALDQVRWEAFEKLIAEIFASRGFHVDLTGRSRNRSGDIYALRAGFGPC